MAITINTNGFDINFAQPIDKRLIVDRVSGTTASLVSLQPVYNYKNMYVWVKQEKAFYYLNDVVADINFPGASVGDWTKLISGSGSVGGSASAIDFEEIAFGTGTGITSSNYFTFDKSKFNLLSSTGSSFTNSKQSIILGGDSNSINNSCYSSIIGGTGLSINATSYSFNSTLIGGSKNCFSGTTMFDSSIVGGSKNIIEGGNVNSSILGGCKNFLGDESYNSVILGGFCNLMDGSPAESRYSAIIAGKFNIMCDGIKYSSIIGGCDNLIRDQSYHSSIIGGKSNKLCYCSDNSAIIAGSKNNIINSDSSLISGSNNTICKSAYSSIIGGAGSSIGTQSKGLQKEPLSPVNRFNTIIGGEANKIIGSSSCNSSIIAGASSSISESQGSVIIGGFGLTLSNENNVVYVPKLKIATASNSDSVTKVLVWDTDDNYVKWRDASTLGGGATGCAKSGYVSGASFTGSPSASATVYFSSPYSSASYSVVVTAHAFNSEDYVYSVINKLSTGFTIRIDSPSTPTPIGATAMWITNCWDGSGLSSGGSGGGNAAFLPLPVPKINLMQGSLEVEVYQSIDNTISATSSVIQNYPVLINMDFTGDHFSNPYNRIFIEMVHYKRKSTGKKNGPLGGRTPNGKSYVVPPKNIENVGQDESLPWIAAGLAAGGDGFWSRSGGSSWYNGIDSDPIGIDRPNHIEVNGYTISSYPIWQYLNGRFEFYDVKYRDTTGATASIETLIPSTGKSRVGRNRPTNRFAYSPFYTPYYCAFRYIQWIPTANGGRGQIVSGPLSRVIKVTGLNFPFQVDYQQSAVLGFPVCDISTQWTSNPSDSYRKLKCDWESNLP